jgi:hypothetical protein
VSQFTRASLGDQLDSLRRRLNQQPGLPFLEHLSPHQIEASFRRVGHRWRDRIYTPVVTLGIFLSQVLSDDHSCSDAVARFQKYRADRDLPPVAPETGSYCDARKRLPEEGLWDLVRRTGRAIHQHAEASWLFRGRTVKILDGSTVSMPDTPANQAAYPQPRSQRPGLGFPIARILVVFSLAVGTVLEAVLGPYQGKQTSELALLRCVVDQFQPGDIVLADRFFCSYWVLAELQRRGVDVVVRLHQRRKADFRRGRRLGREDHVVTWRKPTAPPEWMSRAEYDAMPAQLTVRELRVRVRDRSKRVRTLVVVTTLLDPKAYPSEAIKRLYQQRWHAELDLRSLKSVMQMDVLRTMEPAMVRKEVAVHLLAYNLIRGILAEGARSLDLKPRTLSFKGGLETVRAFEEDDLYDPVRIQVDLPRLVVLIRRRRVGDRPDRYEPRAIKRRPRPHRLLVVPRREARRRKARGLMIDDRT